MMRFILSKLNYSKYIQKFLTKRWGRFLLVFLTATYIFVPIDFFPEIIAGPLGYIDDAVLFSVLVNEYRKYKNGLKQSKTSTQGGELE